jgi:hypothetical protein
VKPWKTSKRVKRRFRKILSSKELYASLEAIIKDPDHKNFASTLRLLLEYGEIAKIDPVMEDDDTPDSMQPTALPPHVHRKETVTKVFNEAGDLIKVFGKQELKLKKKQEAEIVDAEFTVEEE